MPIKKLGKWIFITINATVFLILIFVLLAITFNKSLRVNSLSLIQGLFQTQRHIGITRLLVEPDFEQINNRLLRQLHLTYQLGSDSPQTIDQFYTTIGHVMDKARTSKDLVNLRPFLKKLAEKQPRSYLPQLWYAKSLTATKDTKALNQIKHAISLMPSDNRAYRLALSINKNSKVFCDQWFTSQEGGLLSADHTGIFGGLSLKRMAIEPILENNPSSNITNMGLQLNEVRDYDFNFSEPVKLDSFILRLATFPGTKLNINNIRLITDKDEHTYKPKDLKISSNSAYFLSNQSLIFVSKTDQEVLIEGFRSSNKLVKRIVLTGVFSRLGLINSPGCLPKRDFN